MSEFASSPVRREHAALVLVDLQADFLPGGALAVAGADEILVPIRDLLASASLPFAVATQDWHPPEHVSFASNHAGRQPFETIALYGEPQVLWPVHCVAGTPGAALDPAVEAGRVRAIVRKGTDADADSYSGFRNNRNAAHERQPTGLGGYLRECGVQQVYVCGLARDFCVSWTALDAAELGFATTVIWDLTRAVDPASDAAIERALRARRIAIADSASLR